MISSVSITNLRSIKDLGVEIAPLSVLVGKNGSGKWDELAKASEASSS